MRRAARCSFTGLVRCIFPGHPIQTVELTCRPHGQVQQLYPASCSNRLSKSFLCSAYHFIGISLCCGRSGTWGQRGQFFPGFVNYFREGLSVRAQMHPTQSSCTENRVRPSLERDDVMEAFRSLVQQEDTDMVILQVLGFVV